MRTRQGTPTTAIAAACLITLALAAGCTSPPAGPSALASPAAAPSPAPLPANAGSDLLIPQPAPAPAPTTTGSVTAGGSGDSLGSDSTAPRTGANASDTPGTATAAPSPVGNSAAAKPGGTTVTPAPSASAGTTAQTATVPPDSSPTGPAVYFVAIDDGGSRGVRFGCNDSLVAVRGPASEADPLTVALGRLLASGGPSASEVGLYDALAGSSLHFVSGYFSGTTVVVNLGGTLRPGGVCDIPRIEAQLTHTVVAASGATRAEIYINGKTLAEALSLG
ncbi:hypothetical protein ACIQC5_17690 [Paenarthrobacter sp. NPDC092416]|uniref:GerMN domain-containing protein n=1 Tax=Paenarthrobacter sp. NPDC092416 TaxID=3364386 RepID=UPI003804C579